MESVLKMKLYLDSKAQRILDGQSKILNWLYNHLLEEAHDLRARYQEDRDPITGQTLYGKRGLRNLIPTLKQKFLFLKTVHSSPLKNAALRLGESITAYQKSRKGKRKGKKCGWPKFRSQKRKFFSLLYDEPGKGFKVDGKSLRISLGRDADGTRLHLEGVLERSLDDFKEREIRNLRLTSECGEYFAIFTVKEPEPAKKPPQKVIALDPNHKNLAYGVGSDEKAYEFKNPWFLKKLQVRIDQVKSRRDHTLRKSVKIEREDGRSFFLHSRRWNYFNKKLENLYRVRREQTKTYLYTVSHFLCCNYDVISIGDYIPRGGGISKGMRRAMNNESLIGRFKEILSWVATKSGKYYMEWEEKGSTRTCYHCGHVIEGGISPDIRIWQCPNEGCQKVNYRDENAALNGLKVTYKNFKSPGSGHFVLPDHIPDKMRWALRYNGLGLQSRLIPGIVMG
ncbi:MAG: transposase [Oligoflexales bacterium]|nr:transposase [Oligoflexales bacterium]